MLRDLLLRARSLLRRDAVERELQDELSFHLDQLMATYEQQGLPLDEAQRRARLSLGGFDQIKEAHRDARGTRLFSDFGRDVHHALRQMLRAPGFAALAMLCLGLGIGVNTTIFSVVDAVMLQTLPVSGGDRIVSISRGDRPTMTYREYETLAARTRLLDGVTASFPLESDLEVDGVSEFVTSEIVPANYGPVLGAGLAVGRWFDDDREMEAVISHAVWQRRFNLNPGVLGRRIRSESQSYTVVGVAMPAFSGTFAPLRTDIWVPLRTRPLIDASLDKAEGPWQMRLLFGRLAASASAPQVAAEVNAIDAQLERETSRESQTPSPLVVEHVRGVPDPGLKQRGATLSVLLGAVVGLVLLIACVNVGNLLLVRGALRQREFAVRRALGASRLRLLRQLLTESLVLAAGGGLCGIVLAVWTNRVLETSVPSAFGAFAVRLGLSVDWRAVAFATLITIVTTILCGLWPAWRASRAASLVTFKNEIGAGAPRRPIGLVAQVVMSLVLLFVAGSFVQSLLRLYSIDPGFAVAGRLYAYTFVPAPPATPESRQAFYARMLEQVRGLPRVQSASLTNYLPLMPIGRDCAAVATAEPVSVTANEVGPAYFETMGLGVIAGREFTAVDQSSDAAVIVISQSLARRMWPNGSGLGERVLVGCKSAHAAVVVGIVRDAAITNLNQRAPLHIYRPLTPQFAGLRAVIVRTDGDAATSVLPLRRLLLDMGEGIRVYTVQPFDEHLAQRYAPFRWAATVLTGFGTLALLLAAVGLYGVIAYRVALRTQELGVRMALGASRQEIFRSVLWHGLKVVLIGVAIGEIFTAALTGLAGAIVSDIVPSGVMTHLGVGAIWIVVALAACFVPAARAARVDPLVALRHE